MKKYYFTFGMGQPNEGYCQPIEAVDGLQARKRMLEIYGNKWSHQYSAEEFKQYREEGLLVEKLLPDVKG